MIAPDRLAALRVVVEQCGGLDDMAGLDSDGPMTSAAFRILRFVVSPEAVEALAKVLAGSEGDWWIGFKPAAEAVLQAIAARGVES